MLSGDDITNELAKGSVFYNADTAWFLEDGTHYNRTNLEEWVRWNVVQSLQRSKLLDCFALLWSRLNKCVRHVIPFSHIDELRCYEFDVCISSLAIPAKYSEFQELLRQEEETGVEPWMLPEVEAIFKLLCKGPSSRYDTAGYTLAENGYVSHGSCGRFCPFFQIKLVLIYLFGTRRKGGKVPGEDGLPDLELDILTKENEFACKGSVECPCSAQDVLSEGFLNHYRRILSQAKHSEIFYGVHEQERETKPMGIHLFPASDEKRGFSQAYSRVVDREEFVLHQKISSENVKNIWKRAIPNVRSKEVSTKSKHASCKFSNEKASRITEATAHQMGACHMVLPPKVNYIPSKPPGLNVEVPEFYPRKDDVSLSQDVTQLYFPSGSLASFSRNLFPYIGDSVVEDRKISLDPGPSVSMNAVSNAGLFSAPQKINLPHYGFQSDFRGHILQNYQAPNFQSQQHPVMQQPQIVQQQQLPPNPLNNFLIPIVQNPLNLLIPGADNPPVSACPNVASGTSFDEQQAWMVNILRSHYLQQLNNQSLPQVDQSIYTPQHTTGFQHRLPETVNHFTQRTQCEQKLPCVNPPNRDLGANGGAVMPKVESKEDHFISPPKNIPVFQRPPESYNFTQNENNCRRRNGGGGGGGGAVLANLIVLTKGGGRWKSNKHHASDHGVREKVVKDNRSTKGEKSGMTCEHFLNKIENFNVGSHLQDISECTPSISSQRAPANESSHNKDLLEEISTIVFEPSSASSTMDNIEPVNSSIGSPEGVLNPIDPNNCRVEEDCKEECDGSMETFLRDSRKGIHKTMTSTPIKEGIVEAENSKSLEWLDVTIQDERLSVIESDTPKHKGIEEEDQIPSIPDGGNKKTVQASKSLESSVPRWSDVKVTLSDPSFPPIRGKKSRGSRLKPSDSSWSPTHNFSGHRRLYSDVLVPKAVVKLSNYKDNLVSDASSSVDSLEKRFGELERMALEQYQSQSSDDSVARIYHELEMQAVEQYRSSFESEIRIPQDQSCAKEDSTELIKESCCSSRLSGVKEPPLPSVPAQNKDQPTKHPFLNASKQPEVVTLLEAKDTENFKTSTLSSTSLASEELKPETANGNSSLIPSLNSDLTSRQTAIKSETEIFKMEGYSAEGVSPQSSHSNISSRRLKNKRSKNSYKPVNSMTQGRHNVPDRGAASNTEINVSSSEVLSLRETSQHPSRFQLPPISLMANKELSTDNIYSAQREDPNEQRTQASTTGGTKSEDKKEDPIPEKGIGVPEAWVQNHVHTETFDQQRGIADKVLFDCSKNSSLNKSAPDFELKKICKCTKGKNMLSEECGTAETSTSRSKEKLNRTMEGSSSTEKKGKRSKKRDNIDKGCCAVETLRQPDKHEEKLHKIALVMSAIEERKRETTKIKNHEGTRETITLRAKSEENFKCSEVEYGLTEGRTERSTNKVVLGNASKATEDLEQSVKLKENLLITLEMSGSLDKDYFISDESKRGPSKKRRRGNRRKHNKATSSEAVLPDQSKITSGDNCKVIFLSSNEDIDGLCVDECKDIDGTIKQDGNLNNENHKMKQSVPVSHSNSTFNDILGEVIGNPDGVSVDMEIDRIESTTEFGSTRKKKKAGAGRRRRRNRKLADQGLLNILSETSYLPLSQQENPSQPCANGINSDKKPVNLDYISLCKENNQHLRETPCDVCNGLSQKLATENNDPEYHRGIELYESNPSMNLQFSMSPPKIVELSNEIDEILAFEEIQLDLACCEEEMAGLIPRQTGINEKPKFDEECTGQSPTEYELVGSRSHDNQDITGIESKSVWRVPVGAGCTSAIARKVDLESQLLIPSFYGDATTEGGLKYHIADINVKENAFCSENLMADEGSMSTYMNFGQHLEIGSDVVTHGNSSPIPVPNHYGLPACPCAVKSGPTACGQSLDCQISTQSLARTSNESTPRTPRSSTSAKSTASSPSVLCKLMRSGKKTRKPKVTGSNGPSSRPTPSCALQ